MIANLKSVVVRTQKLSTTKLFFENVLGFKIKESSHQHFVVHTKGVRIVFMESETELDIELYIDSNTTNCTNLTDPNGIKLIVNKVENESIK
jgi:catechol-2,3-dioxygenase